ncbi:MAG TPA: SHOCT domain-containing protein, partial [Acidimicrobiales bacterium]|nr:SHOCT domain-containing protein [Acidimicrobiales bacterium]
GSGATSGAPGGGVAGAFGSGVAGALGGGVAGAPGVPGGPRADPGAGPPAAPAGDVVAQIERLAALYERGVLTREEFEGKKAELLARL